jgi:hypothetical protein
MSARRRITAGAGLAPKACSKRRSASCQSVASWTTSARQSGRPCLVGDDEAADPVDPVGPGPLAVHDPDQHVAERLAGQHPLGRMLGVIHRPGVAPRWLTTKFRRYSSTVRPSSSRCRTPCIASAAAFA